MDYVCSDFTSISGSTLQDSGKATGKQMESTASDMN